MNTNENNLKLLRAKQALLIKNENDTDRVLAKDIMIKPIFLFLDDEIEEILEKLQSESINYCVVVDNEHHFIGEISDEMILKIIAHTSLNEPLVKILDIGYRRGINFTQTKDYVRRHKNTVHQDTPIYDIMRLIDKKGSEFIPVINNDKRVVGIISPSSILKFILNR